VVDETEDEIVVLDEPKATGDESDPVAELQRQFEALKKDNEKTKAAEVAANQRALAERASADVARQEAANARAAVIDNEFVAIDASITAAKAEADAATRDYSAAAEAGDWAKQADAQRRIARAEARLVQMETTKSEVELRKGAPSESRSVSQPVHSDPFESHLTKFTPPTADWMRKHRDWVVDPKKNAALVGAHSIAVNNGHVPDTDDYFAAVEKTLGIGEDKTPVRTQPTRRSAPMVAPVNGGAGANSSGSGDNRTNNSVSLSRGEKDRATDGSVVWNRGNTDAKGEILKDGDPRIGKPIGIQEYARRKSQLERGGYYDKSYTHG
jgi:hypothetical protein